MSTWDAEDFGSVSPSTVLQKCWASICIVAVCIEWILYNHMPFANSISWQQIKIISWFLPSCLIPFSTSSRKAMVVKRAPKASTTWRVFWKLILQIERQENAVNAQHIGMWRISNHHVAPVWASHHQTVKHSDIKTIRRAMITTAENSTGGSIYNHLQRSLIRRLINGRLSLDSVMRKPIKTVYLPQHGFREWDCLKRGSLESLPMFACICQAAEWLNEENETSIAKGLLQVSRWT